MVFRIRLQQFESLRSLETAAQLSSLSKFSAHDINVVETRSLRRTLDVEDSRSRLSEMPHCTGVSQVYSSEGGHTGDTQNRKAYILFSCATLRAASIASVWRAFLYPL